jgi:hypothetical protein
VSRFPARSPKRAARSSPAGRAAFAEGSPWGNRARRDAVGSSRKAEARPPQGPKVPGRHALGGPPERAGKRRAQGAGRTVRGGREASGLRWTRSPTLRERGAGA